MGEEKWFETATINDMRLSIAQQILLYLFSHRSFVRPEDIPHDECRTTSAIAENVGGSSAGVVKALKGLSSSTESERHGGKKIRTPLIKIRPKHGRGRLPGSPPLYYSLTPYGEAEAMALFKKLEFNIDIKTNGAHNVRRGNFDSLKNLCSDIERSGRKIDVSDMKKVFHHIIKYGCYNIEGGMEAQLIKILTVPSHELPYPTETVHDVACDMELLAEIAADKAVGMVSREDFKIEAISEKEYKGHVSTIGVKHALQVKGVDSDMPNVVRYKYDAYYGDKRYMGWIDIGIYGEGTEGTRLAVKSYSDNPWDAAEIRNTFLFIDVLEKIALEVLKSACAERIGAGN